MSSRSCCREKFRVCYDVNQGMRKYMEDEVSVVIEDTEKRSAFLGIFDGHGGKEASIYAKEHLYENIKHQTGFYDDDPEKVKLAIREGFVKTHWDMFGIVETWPKRKDGQNSTSGTTATIAIIRDSKLYIAHVGDSAAVIAAKNENNKFVSTDLTVDHKPESIDEKSRIESLGGRVVSSNGVPRVVWKRTVKNTSPVIGQPTTRYEYVPFLAVSRALGDVWSYDAERQEFIVSPEPEVQVFDIIPGYHKFIVIASDGLWGVMNGEQVVDAIQNFEVTSKTDASKRNCSKHIINKSLSLWQQKRSRADNISAVVAFFDDELSGCVPGDPDSEADTDIVSENEDESPPLSKSNSCISPLQRHLVFETVAAMKSEKELCVRLEETTQGSKRKITTENPVDNTKKLRSASPVSVSEENSHQCLVITHLSSESLYELQLDEDLGFADDESDVEQPLQRHIVSHGNAMASIVQG